MAGLVALTFFPVLEERPLSLMDALFTSVSAVTLTGLSTVSVSLFSRQGQWIMLVLMQTGGIGILYFASRLLIIPGRSASRSQHMMVRERWSEVNELAPKKLTQNIILGVLSLEILGTTILYFLFSGNGVDSPFFVSLFHSVSALVNGGFTTFTAGNLELLTTAPIAAALGILILLGRLGYVVFAEVFQKTTHKSHQWSLNVPVSLIGTAVIIILGTGLYMFVGRNSNTGFWTALMRTINVRTAGFSIIDPAQSFPVARILSMLLMFVGGAAGSVTGGIKITAAVILVLTAVKGYGTEKRIILFRRRISVTAQSRTVLFFLRAVGLAVTSILLLALTETVFNSTAGFAFGDLVFESVSAFTTSGLSTGITTSLSNAGKLILIATMITGRIGLLLLVAQMGRGPRSKPEKVTHTIYPEGEVLLG
ncbi:potassium transporter TrkG [Marispirochaeta sp.]|uniref:potassium transporter TrkG n=1 Tax=Marispirochaeta sp. TaxID=2038653 RepID=UPI0029C60ADE|nr:potassium transporter TrkG [Marispirochaeta sp.]